MLSLKNMAVLAIFLAATPTSYAGFPDTQWAVHITNFTGSFPAKPKEGFKNLSFSISVLSGPLTEKFYYSQYINFNSPTSDNEAYYYGIQPAGNGQALIIFSYFGKAGRAIDIDHCSSGADGGNGITCNTVKIPFALGNTYDFLAVLTEETASENLWEGYVTDAATQEKVKIGAWATPKTLGYLSGSNIGFIEDYTGIKNCAEIPATSAYFSAGTSQLDANTIATSVVNKAYKVGVCAHSVNFSSFIDERGGISIIQNDGEDNDS